MSYFSLKNFLKQKGIIPMTFFPFVDPNRRPQAKIRKMTEELTQKFQAIDPDLTLIHNDNFIDYGPEVFPKLSKICIRSID